MANYGTILGKGHGTEDNIRIRTNGGYIIPKDYADAFKREMAKAGFDPTAEFTRDDPSGKEKAVSPKEIFVPEEHLPIYAALNISLDKYAPNAKNKNNDMSLLDNQNNIEKLQKGGRDSIGGVPKDFTPYFDIKDPNHPNYIKKRTYEQPIPGDYGSSLLERAYPNNKKTDILPKGGGNKPTPNAPAPQEPAKSTGSSMAKKPVSSQKKTYPPQEISLPGASNPGWAHANFSANKPIVAPGVYTPGVPLSGPPLATFGKGNTIDDRMNWNNNYDASNPSKIPYGGSNKSGDNEGDQDNAGGGGNGTDDELKKAMRIATATNLGASSVAMARTLYDMYKNSKLKYDDHDRSEMIQYDPLHHNYTEDRVRMIDDIQRSSRAAINDARAANMQPALVGIAANYSDQVEKADLALLQDKRKLEEYNHSNRQNVNAQNTAIRNQDTKENRAGLDAFMAAKQASQDRNKDTAIAILDEAGKGMTQRASILASDKYMSRNADLLARAKNGDADAIAMLNAMSSSYDTPIAKFPYTSAYDNEVSKKRGQKNTGE